MLIRPDPYSHDLVHEIFRQFTGRHHDPPSRLPSEFGRRFPQNLFPDDGFDTIGTNQDIAVKTAAIRQFEHNAIAALLKLRHGAVEINRTRGQFEQTVARMV